MKYPLHRANRQANRWLPQFLAVLLALPPTAFAQSQAPANPAGGAPTRQSLRVIPLAGDGEMNDLQNRIMAPLVVQVLDQESRPVEGADVTFRFPIAGAGAAFADQKNSQTVRTNTDGQAAAVGWAANGTVGRFQVQVTAARGNELGTAVLFMTNVASVAAEAKQKPKSWWSSKWAKIGVIAGAAAVIAVVILATRNSGSSTPTPSTTTITAVPGFPTIGGAQ
jgi:hypothetical protein